MTGKPITVARAEFSDKMVQLIEGSGLPAFIVGDTLRNVLVQVEQAEKMQLERDKAEYEKSLSEKVGETEDGR